MTSIIKHYKKISVLLLMAYVISLLIPLKVIAGDVLWDRYEIPSTRQKDRVYDAADLLTDSEEENLLSTLDELSNKWQCNIIVLTTDSHNGSIQACADDYFDYNGFCSEFNESGVLFMLSMEDREWAFSTSGAAQYAFTDYGQEYLLEQMLPYLREGDYYDAFNKYAEVSDYYLDLYSQGTAFDKGYKPPKTAADHVRSAVISLIIGLVVAIFPIMGMKSELKTVNMKPNAAGYAPGGAQVRVKEDVFINKTLTRTPKPKDTERSSSSGGSTLHTSSSGHSHGGSSGHF